MSDYNDGDESLGDIGNKIIEGEVIEPVTEVLDNPGEFLSQVLLDKVNTSAKSVVKCSIDFLLALALLFVQAVNCNMQIHLVKEHLAEIRAVNSTIHGRIHAAEILAKTAVDLEVCDSAEDHIKKYELLPYLGGALFAYGVIVAIFVWLHSYFTVKKMKMKEASPLKKLYACTDRIVVFDSLLEIPTALQHSPISTIFLWVMFAIGCVFLALMNGDFVKQFGEHVDQSSFQLNSAMVAFNLYKLTGDTSQYWVLWVTTKEKKAKKNKEDFEKVVAV